MPLTRAIFVDASALLAIVNSKDANHTEAKNFLNQWRDHLLDYTKLATSDSVLGETITRIRFRIDNGNVEAIKFVTSFFESKLIETIYTNQDVFHLGLKIFQKVEQKNIDDGFISAEDKELSITDPRHHPTLSFVDAVSLACVVYFNMPAIFAFDPDLRFLSVHGALKEEKDLLGLRGIKVFP